MVEQSEFVCRIRAYRLVESLLTVSCVGMATPLPLLPSALAADEPARLLAHVPLEDVRREGRLPQLTFPAPQIDNTLAPRQLSCIPAAGLGETS